MSRTRLIAKAIGPQLRGHFKAEVERADHWVDEALGAVSEEEPTLASWLDKDEEVQRMMRANGSAMYWTILNGLDRGRSLEEVVEKVETLVERAVVATSWRAVMMDRRGR